MSRSAEEVNERQEALAKSPLAQHALALLARLFRYGEISYHGGFINLATGATSVLRIDAQLRFVANVDSVSTPYHYPRLNGSVDLSCFRISPGLRSIPALAMEGKFATDGLQAIDEGDDILMAMARELLTEKGIGEMRMLCGSSSWRSRRKYGELVL